MQVPTVIHKLDHNDEQRGPKPVHTKDTTKARMTQWKKVCDYQCLPVLCQVTLPILAVAFPLALARENFSRLDT